MRMTTYQPDQIVRSLVEPELEAVDALLECETAATSSVKDAESVLTALRADPDATAAQIVEAREELAMATRRRVAATNARKKAESALKDAEYQAWRSPEIVCRRHAIVTTGSAERSAKIRAIVQRFREEIAGALSDNRLVGRSISAEIVELSKTLTGQELANLGAVGQFRGGHVPAQLDQGVETMLAQVEEQLAAFRFASVVAHSVTGQSGYRRLEDFTFTPDEFEPQALQDIRNLLEPRVYAAWLNGGTAEKPQAPARHHVGA